MSPHDWAPWVTHLADRLEVRDEVTIAAADQLRVGHADAPLEVAERLWDLAALAARYESFCASWASLATRPPAQVGEAVRGALQASAEIEALLRADPLLPSGIAEGSPIGANARALYRTMIATLSAAHEVVASANLFLAFEQAIHDTESMSERAFGQWLWFQTASRA